MELVPMKYVCTLGGGAPASHLTSVRSVICNLHSFREFEARDVDELIAERQPESTTLAQRAV